MLSLTEVGAVQTTDAATQGDPPIVVFEGNERFSRRQLLAAMRRFHVSLNGDFARTDADDAAYFLREYYFEQGFSRARVEYTFNAAPPSVVFRIDEGSQQLIRNVEFTGNAAIPSDRLLEIFNAGVRQSNLHPFGRLRYVATAVDFANSEILRALHIDGFMDATVNVTSVENEGFETDLTIQIVDGIQYSVASIRVIDEGVEGTGLEESLADKVGHPFQSSLQTIIRTRVQDWYRNRGYLNPTVDINADLDRSTGQVFIALGVEHGQRYRLGEIRIEGLTKTLPAAVMRRINLRPGEWYDVSEIDSGVRRLWFTGAFDEASATPEVVDENTADVVLKMEEGRAKQFRFTLGYSEWDGGFGEIQYVDRNILGTLNRLSVDTFASQKSYGARTTLADPWFLGTDATGSVAAFYARRELPAYKTTEYGGEIGIERRFNLPNETGYRIAYGWKQVADSTIFGDDIDTGDVDYTLGALTFRQAFDTRNNVILPMKGLFAVHEVGIVSPFLLGDLSFFRFEAHFTYYQPLREITAERPFVPFFVFNHRAGVLLPYGDTKFIPVQERFFLGGPTSVRSYQLYGLGPKDSDGDPTGGLAMLLGNIELQWPVWNNIYTVFFTDMGNLAPDLDELTWDDTQVAVGSGLRVYTPIGAIRVDYGYNVNRKPGDPVGNWQFGFGFTF